MHALLVNGDTHDAHNDAANRVRCMKSGVNCSWRAHLTRVFTTSQVFWLARTTGECSSPKHSRTPAESGENRHTETFMSRSSQIIQAPLGMRITNTSLRAVSSGFAVLWPSCVQVGKNAAIFAILPVKLTCRANI